MWIGLAPVYIVACIKAVLGGPRHKPVYKVTRKITRVQWYWRQTLPQALLGASLPAAFVIGIATGTLPSLLILVTVGYWGLIGSGALLGFVVRGWFGISPTDELESLERGAKRRLRGLGEAAAGAHPMGAAALGRAS